MSLYSFKKSGTIIVLCLMLSFCWTLAIKAQTPTPLQIRVGLLKLGLPSFFFIIPSDGQIDIFNEKTNQTVYTGPAKVLLIKTDPQGMQVFVENTSLAPTRDPLIFSAGGKLPHYLWIGSKRKLEKAYRGRILVYPFPNKLLALNLISLEEYLRSVVPSEIGNKAPFPALLAQAIAARTYALRNLVRHAPYGFHLCDQVHCQAYFGLLKEFSVSTEAVECTRGQILTFENKPANSVYHANCGGQLAASHQVWKGKPVPYLIAHEDRVGTEKPFCAWGAGLYRQTEKSTPEKEKDPMVPEAFFTKNPGLKLPPTTGSYILYSLNGKSTYRVENHKGRGHKVGMCQDGAVGMARAGYNALQILSFYYPSTALQNYEHTGLPPSPALQAKAPTETFSVATEKAQATKKGTTKTKERARNLFLEQLGGTKGKRTKDFRKWFWANMPPVKATKSEFTLDKKKKNGKKKAESIQKKKKKKSK